MQRNHGVVFVEQGINQKILSMDFKNYKEEIKTADAQNSQGRSNRVGNWMLNWQR